RTPPRPSRKRCRSTMSGCSPAPQIRRRVTAAARAMPTSRHSEQTMSRNAETSSIAARVEAVLTWLESHGSHTNREGMARFGIVSAHVYGISVAALRAHAKVLGKSHALALALWETGSHEARMLAAFV